MAKVHASGDRTVTEPAILLGDFGEMIFKERRLHAGVILLRLRTTRLPALRTRLTQLLRDFAEETSSFLVVTERLVRVPGR